MKNKIFKLATLAMAMSLCVAGNVKDAKADVVGEVGNNFEITLEDGTTVPYVDPTSNSDKMALKSGSLIATMTNYDVGAEANGIVYTIEWYEGDTKHTTEMTKEDIKSLGLSDFQAVKGVAETGTTINSKLMELFNANGFNLQGYEAFLYADLGYITDIDSNKNQYYFIDQDSAGYKGDGASYEAVYASEKYNSAEGFYSNLRFLGFISVGTNGDIGFSSSKNAEIIKKYSSNEAKDDCLKRANNVKIISTSNTVDANALCVLRLPENTTSTRALWGAMYKNYWYIDSIDSHKIVLKNNPLVYYGGTARYDGDEVEVGKEYDTKNVHLGETFVVINGVSNMGSGDDSGNSGSSDSDEDNIDSNRDDGSITTGTGNNGFTAYVYKYIDESIAYDDPANTNMKVSGTEIKYEGANTFYVDLLSKDGINNNNESYYFIVNGSPVLESLMAEWYGKSVLVGDEISEDLIGVYAKYLSNSQFNKVTDYNIDSKLITKEGINTFTVTYKGKTAQFNVNGTKNSDDTIVDDDPNDGRIPDRLELRYSGSELEVGSEVDKNKLSLYCYYSNADVTKAKNVYVKYTGLNIDKIGDNMVSASYKTKTANVIINGYKYATIKFNSNNGSNVDNLTKRIGSKLGNLKKSKKTGYTFAGWYEDSALGNEVNSDTIVNGNMTLYAKWDPHKYTVKLLPNGGEGQLSEMTCTYDVEYVIPANKFIRSGYTFVGWDKDASTSRAKYGDKAKLSNLTSEDGKTISLYAIWDDGSGEKTGPGEGKTDPKKEEDKDDDGDDDDGGNKDKDKDKDKDKPSGDNGDGNGGGSGGKGNDGSKDGDKRKPMDGNDPRYEVIDKNKDSDGDGIPDWLDNDDDNDGILDKDDTDDDGDGIKDEQDPDYRWLSKEELAKLGYNEDGTPMTGDTSKTGFVLIVMIGLIVGLVTFILKRKTNKGISDTDSK